MLLLSEQQAKAGTPHKTMKQKYYLTRVYAEVNKNKSIIKALQGNPDNSYRQPKNAFLNRKGKKKRASILSLALQPSNSIST